MNNLNKKAFGGLFFLIVALGVLLFGPVGTIYYWQEWVFLAVFGVSALLITFYLMKKDPGLLARRVKAGSAAETQKSQKIIQFIAQIAFVVAIVVSALDHRFGWSVVPPYKVAAGDILVALGLYFVFLVFRENSYTSAIIELGREQKVIASGPYAIVRHPMYAGAFVMLLGVPLALGSWWGLLPVAALMAAIVRRLVEEEKFLSKNLAGYQQYQKQVKFRLLPFVW
jgi:protein-S-isoprenylcysteine O-methyltransferase Ste14